MTFEIYYFKNYFDLSYFSLKIIYNIPNTVDFDNWRNLLIGPNDEEQK